MWVYSIQYQCISTNITILTTHMAVHFRSLVFTQFPSNSHHSTISLPWCYHYFTQVIPWFYHDLPKLYIVIPFLPWFSHLFTTWFWLFPGKQPGHLVLRRRARQRPRHRDHQVISIEFQSASLAKDLLLEKQVKTARDIIDLLYI